MKPFYKRFLTLILSVSVILLCSCSPNRQISSDETTQTPDETSLLNKEQYSDKPLVIGVAGASASGKTSLCRYIANKQKDIVILDLDSFYKPLNRKQHEQALNNNYNFDCPKALDLELAVKCLKQIINSDFPVRIPKYCFGSHKRDGYSQIIKTKPRLILIDGLFALHNKKLLELIDIKVFMDCDLDVCLARRILRDIKERGDNLENTIGMWFKYVKPAYERLVKPTSKFADIIMPSSISVEEQFLKLQKYITTA
ncbi:MAG: uridine-cytidine kinase [Holosporales bacterium]|jgi:uridine kinase|nr:uridine-cytidine kinase [Holosporales bacterium]